MSPENSQISSDPQVREHQPTSHEDGGGNRQADYGDAAPKGIIPQPATVIVRGETVKNDRDDAKSSSENSPKAKPKSPPKEVSEAKVRLQSKLPALADDPEIGTEKEQTVTRDGKADLAFTGTLIASAASPVAIKGHWQEYRIYHTNGGKHVFSKIKRTVYVEEKDSHEAEIFDPAPTSVSSQVLRTARDLTRSHPMTWMDAAVGFFGYDPLAKTLYRKFGDQFDERLS